MEIRQAKNNDIPHLAEMYLELYRHISGPKTSSLEAMKSYANKKLHQRHHFTFVAEDKGELIGVISVKLLGKSRGHLIDAYVIPSHRRKGILRALESRVITFLKKRDISNITLEVQSDNIEGMNSWISLGYRAYEVSMKKKI